MTNDYRSLIWKTPLDSSPDGNTKNVNAKKMNEKKKREKILVTVDWMQYGASLFLSEYSPNVNCSAQEIAPVWDRKPNASALSVGGNEVT